MRYLLTHLMLPVLVLLLALPDTSAAQRQNRDGGGDGGGSQRQAIPRSEAPAPTPAPAPSPAPAAAAASEPSQAAPRTTPRTQERDTQEPTAPSGAARPREGRATVRTAVPRGSVPPPRQDTTVVVPVYYRSYWPWGFGGLGFGSYYGGSYGGFHDPYYPYGGYRTYGYGQYGYPPSSYTYGFEGSLRLKIKPRDAQVYVDGYYVGIVDDFDGVLQRLHIEAGPHRIEVRAPGYEPLVFDVRVRFDDTTKLEGDLKRIP